MNFYNEIDPHAAAWLRELISMGEIPPGVVDTRSITEIRPHELLQYTQCHFFAGIGGWPLALRLAGVPDNFPLWTGSCPCQPFSVAGLGKGTDDARHLWPAWFALINVCRPAIILGEQVSSKAALGWVDGISIDLEGAHYAFAAADLCAPGVGSPHLRQRLYWMADSLPKRLQAGCPSFPFLESRCALLEQSGGPCGLAVAGLEQPGRGDSRPGQGALAHGERPSDQSGGSGHFSRLADASGMPSPEHGEESGQRPWRGAGAGDASDGGGACGLADSEQPRLEGLARNGHDGNQSRWVSQNATGSIATSRSAGAWDSFDSLPCRDGKTRRVESGTFPLVTGLPKGMVHSSDPSLPINPQATPEGRVMRLRGYGNSIVPQLAAQFITAAFEAILELHAP